MSEDIPRRRPAARGLAWAAATLLLLRSQPLRLIGIGLVLQLLVSMVWLPGIGLLVLLIVPALTGGYLMAWQRVASGKSAEVTDLFALMAPGARLLRLVSLAALLAVVAMLVASLLVGEAAEAFTPDLMARLEAGDRSVLAELDPEILTRILLAALAGAAVAGTLGYFAIPLVSFRNRLMLSSIRDGLRALARNWQPLLVFMLLMTAAGLPVMLLAALMAASAGQSLASMWMLLAMVYTLLWQVFGFGAQWVIFSDLFPSVPEGTAAPPGDEDDQLLA